MIDVESKDMSLALWLSLLLPRTLPPLIETVTWCRKTNTGARV